MASITDLGVRALIKKVQQEGKTKTKAHGQINSLTLSVSKTSTLHSCCDITSKENREK
jgi:hypothetical protein